MPQALTVGAVLQKSAEYLKSKGVDSPRLDAELLLAHVLGCDRLKLYLHWDRELNEPDVAAMREMLRRRGQEREPVARIVGQREFYGRPFHVGPATFVPRPETEWLAERAVELLKGEGGEVLPFAAAPATPHKAVAEPAPKPAIETGPKSAAEVIPEESPARPAPPRPRVIDIGTGSGCIAICIALECPEAAVCATDLSEDALQTARDNASALGASGRVAFHRGDLFAGLDGPFDLVVSNPPYIASGAIEGLMPEVSAHDPRGALDGGAAGLEIYARIAREAAPRMPEGARLLLEIGEGQGAAVAALLKAAGTFGDIRMIKDLAGLERYIEATRRGEAATE